jgi:hypothetical protein
LEVFAVFVGLTYFYPGYFDQFEPVGLFGRLRICASQEVGEDLVSYSLERLNFRSLDGFETLGVYYTNLPPGSTFFFQVCHGNLTSNNAKTYQQNPGWRFVVHVSLCIPGRVLPKQRHITEAELEMMAAAQLRVSSICEPERAVSMVPNSTPAWSSHLDHLGSLGDFWGLCHPVTAESWRDQ